jgi:hypothetical protein
MGAVYDGAKNHLRTSDKMIIALRRLFLKAVREIQGRKRAAAAESVQLSIFKCLKCGNSGTILITDLLGIHRIIVKSLANPGN